MTAGERVELRQDDGGMWQWAWVREGGPDGSRRLELPASEPVSTREQAVAEARRAYPSIPVRLPDEERRAAERIQAQRRRSRHWPWLVATAVVAGVLTGVSVGFRRWRTAALVPLVAAGVLARLRRAG